MHSQKISSLLSSSICVYCSISFSHLSEHLHMIEQFTLFFLHPHLSLLHIPFEQAHLTSSIILSGAERLVDCMGRIKLFSNVHPLYIRVGGDGIGLL